MEFEFYVIWKALPPILRGKSPEELKKFGIEDEFIIELLQIKNQKEFAKRFDIREEKTLSNWNKKIEKNNLISQHIPKWAKKLTPNVISALYRTIMKTGRAPEVIAWMKIVEGWTEKTEFEIGQGKTFKIEYKIIKDDED